MVLALVKRFLREAMEASLWGPGMEKAEEETVWSPFEVCAVWSDCDSAILEWVPNVTTLDPEVCKIDTSAGM